MPTKVSLINILFHVNTKMMEEPFVLANWHLPFSQRDFVFRENE
jgi:hypothetical protein